MESANGATSIENPWDLIKTLLAPKTLPHVFLLIAGTGVLYALVSTINDDPGFAAIIFTSAMVSYIILGTFGNQKYIKKWLLIDGYSTNFSRVFGPMILPLSLMSLISISILLTLAKDKNIRDIWAVSLSSLFVFWSIGQGLALRSSIRGIVLRTKSSKRTEISNPKQWDIYRLFIGSIFSSIIIAILRGVIIPNSMENNSLVFQWTIYVFISSLIICFFIQIAKDGIIPLDTSWTKGDRARVHRTGQIIIFLIAWHISSAWSRLSGGDSSAILFEEIILVILTVVSAVWAMTNRNRSKIKLVSKDTAIHWAIAFGFGYAGSITVMSGLTESLPILGDISQTLAIGHILTTITLLLGLKTTLSRPENNESKELSKINEAE